VRTRRSPPPGGPRARRRCASSTRRSTTRARRGDLGSIALGDWQYSLQRDQWRKLAAADTTSAWRSILKRRTARWAVHSKQAGRARAGRRIRAMVRIQGRTAFPQVQRRPPTCRPARNGSRCRTACGWRCCRSRRAARPCRCRFACTTGTRRRSRARRRAAASRRRCWRSARRNAIGRPSRTLDRLRANSLGAARRKPRRAARPSHPPSGLLRLTAETLRTRVPATG
jgi:hypothetical protein